MKINFHLLLGLLVLAGCSDFDEQKLVGKWVATEVVEGGRPLDIDLSPVGFEFSADGNYHFTSTIKYEEAGTYFVDGTYLYTLDTLNEASSEKAVEINCLEDNQLILHMKANGKDKVIKLKRDE
ncbi:MAG TPA: hypothetical protein ENJ95_14595 [Bacteroidetes bacterium]|nr:hypothetical protein [Bacteroidota bacterium]